MKRILHTEASLGWGGQERRILAESIGLRQRGYEIFFAVAAGAELARRASQEGFVVYEIPLAIKKAVPALFHLARILRRHQIDMINTHSSADAWLGGLAGKMLGIPVLRTRHLSARIKKGLNARILYNTLAQATVTTCASVAERIQRKANLSEKRCRSIPTGVDFHKASCTQEEISAFKRKYHLNDSHIIVGTVCILRSWKGIYDLLEAAKLLSHRPEIKWVIVGCGPSESLLKERWHALGVEENVLFIGHLENPFPAFGALDIFTLLSTDHEGVSQASLQAAYLEKPLITTDVGGLPEVCLEGKTGLIVAKKDPQSIARAVEKLADNPSLRNEMGKNAKQLVIEKFSLEKTLNDMEEMILSITREG